MPPHIVENLLSSCLGASVIPFCTGHIYGHLTNLEIEKLL